MCSSSTSLCNSSFHSDPLSPSASSTVPRNTKITQKKIVRATAYSVRVQCHCRCSAAATPFEASSDLSSAGALLPRQVHGQTAVSRRQHEKGCCHTVGAAAHPTRKSSYFITEGALHKQRLARQLSRPEQQLSQIFFSVLGAADRSPAVDLHRDRPTNTSRAADYQRAQSAP